MSKDAPAAGSKKMAPTGIQMTTSELVAWLDLIAAEQTLVAPVALEAVILFRHVRSSSEIAWGAGRPVLSPKEVFFPATERLFSIQYKDAGLKLEETLPEGSTVVFGVRGCDLGGLAVLDALFLDQAPVDPYYARRRAQTTLIGLACREMGPNCFCEAVAGGPDRPQGADLWLHENKTGYLVEALTENGRRLLSASGWEVVRKKPTRGKAASSTPAWTAIAWREHFNDTAWERMGERCLSCRACAYVCPTCRCFVVRDETLSTGQSERLRCWDACAGENYRRLAGGHRPRSETGERLRNRFFCKFYYLPEQLSLGAASACTGCGRCSEVCPVGVDIREMLDDLGRPV